MEKESLNKTPKNIGLETSEEYDIIKDNYNNIDEYLMMDNYNMDALDNPGLMFFQVIFHFHNSPLNETLTSLNTGLLGLPNLTKFRGEIPSKIPPVIKPEGINDGITTTVNGVKHIIPHASTITGSTDLKTQPNSVSVLNIDPKPESDVPDQSEYENTNIEITEKNKEGSSVNKPIVDNKKEIKKHSYFDSWYNLESNLDDYTCYIEDLYNEIPTEERYLTEIEAGKTLWRLLKFKNMNERKIIAHVTDYIKTYYGVKTVPEELFNKVKPIEDKDIFVPDGPREPGEHLSRSGIMNIDNTEVPDNQEETDIQVEKNIETGSATGPINDNINTNILYSMDNRSSKYYDSYIFQNLESYQNLYNEPNAWSYLVSNNEDERALMLLKFIYLLLNLTWSCPWYFQKITGLDAAIERKKIMGRDVKIDPARQKISITCLPDAIDNRIGSLLDMYRSIVFSWKQKRFILPANLRKFDMSIYIFQSPLLEYHNKTYKLKGSLDEIEQKPNNFSVDELMEFSKNAIDENLFENRKGYYSYKYFELHNCEIDYNSSKTGYADINNSVGFNPEYTIDILFDDIYESRYNQWTGSIIGDMFSIDLNKTYAALTPHKILDDEKLKNQKLLNAYIIDDTQIIQELETEYPGDEKNKKIGFLEKLKNKGLDALDKLKDAAFQYGKEMIAEASLTLIHKGVSLISNTIDTAIGELTDNKYGGFVKGALNNIGITGSNISAFAVDSLGLDDETVKSKLDVTANKFGEIIGADTNKDLNIAMDEAFDSTQDFLNDISYTNLNKTIKEVIGLDTLSNKNGVSNLGNMLDNIANSVTDYLNNDMSKVKLQIDNLAQKIYKDSQRELKEAQLETEDFSDKYLNEKDFNNIKNILNKIGGLGSLN